jgi:hypothetical protein
MENEVSNLSEGERKNRELEDSVDGVTRARAGSLSAHGLSDLQIADILLLSIEQVIAVHNTEEFRNKFAETANEAIQAQIDRDEGWDAVEQKALENMLTALQYNRDPKYALAAGKIANSATRRTRQNKNDPKVIDGSQQKTNIVILSLNRTFVQRTSVRDNTIDVTPKTVENQPQKRADLPSPKLVEELLAPVTDRPKKVLSEIEEAFAKAGVVFDNDE